MKQLLTILLLTIALQGVTAEDIKKDYLSYKWAKYSFNNFWMKNITDQVSAKNEAAKLNAEGFKLYKSKKDKDAIPKYEAAIDKYPTGEVYYNYGNSLANVKRYEDSIKAYEIALKLDPPRPELALYNIACSYSLMNKPDNAYKYLASAVERGYNAFEYIKKDSDMANLRKQPDWETKLKAIKSKANYDESIRKLATTEESNFVIDRSDSIAEKAINSLRFLTISATVIGLITLIGAAIGLMNIMLVSVSERTREVGLVKAIGGKSKMVSRQFLLEAIIISVLGALLGIVLGVMVGNLFSYVLGTGFVIPWDWVLYGILICTIVGLLAGLYPAIKAGKLNPIEALRYE